MRSKVDSPVDQERTVATRYAACLFILSFWVALPHRPSPSHSHLACLSGSQRVVLLKLMIKFA